MTLRRALDRTLLLMRDEVHETVGDDELISALTQTSIALIADSANIGSYSAQTAYVTTALLMARSGHNVHLVCPPVELVGPQPPLGRGDLVEELARVGQEFDSRQCIRDRTSGRRSRYGHRARQFRNFGSSGATHSIKRELVERASRWRQRHGNLGRRLVVARRHGCRRLGRGRSIQDLDVKLSHVARNPSRMATVFSAAERVAFALAPEGTPFARQLGNFDCVSGGAIVNAILYALARVPGVEGRPRIIEPDTADISNLNRYMLLRQSNLEELKAHDLAAILTGSGLIVEPISIRYEPSQLPSLLPLAASVLVGVDDIPSRWLVQRAGPEWLGVGATTHWSGMASFHEAGLGCAECLHPVDDPGDAPIPTVAFVSFWAGLLTASYFLRHRAGQPAAANEQQIDPTALRPENPTWSGVPRRRGCPSCAVLRSFGLGQRA